MSKWEMVRLGDVCTIVSGTTPKSSVPAYWNGTFNWVTPAELDENSEVIYETQRKITGEGIKNSSLRPFPAGTVLLSSRAPIGKVAIAGTEMYCNQGFKNFICTNKIFNNYLFWFLKGKKEYLNSLGRGATFKEISKKIVEEIEIPLPPLAIQQQIASTLDTAAALLALRKQQLAELDALIQSVFIEMFGDPVVNEKGWKKLKLGELGNFKNGINFRSNEKKHLVKCLNVGDFKNKKSIASSEILNSISLDEKPKEEICLKKNDIVFVRSNGSKSLVGRNMLMVDIDYETTFSGFCIRFRSTSKNINMIYLNEYFNLEVVHRIITQDGRGCSINNLNQSLLSELLIPLPHIDLQTKFAAIVKKIEQQKVLVQQAIDETQTLFDSLMAEYFE